MTDAAAAALRPFRREELALVEAWFRDPDTNRFLGGPGWPALSLDRAAAPLGEFRGAVETGRYRWLAWEAGRAVGFIGCGTYDRWTTWDGGPQGRGVVSTIPVPAAAITVAVDPALRRRGYATAMIRLLLDQPELSAIELFAGGVEPANLGSIRALQKAGFAPLDPEPDFEGIVYYVLRRDKAGI